MDFLTSLYSALPCLISALVHDIIELLKVTVNSRSRDLHLKIIAFSGFYKRKKVILEFLFFFEG